MVAASEELGNRSYTDRQLRRIGLQGIAVAISLANLIIVIVALVLAGMAMNNANRADIRSQEQAQTINALREEVAVLEIRVINAENE